MLVGFGVGGKEAETKGRTVCVTPSAELALVWGSSRGADLGSVPGRSPQSWSHLKMEGHCLVSSEHLSPGCFGEGCHCQSHLVPVLIPERHQLTSIPIRD